MPNRRSAFHPSLPFAAAGSRPLRPAEAAQGKTARRPTAAEAGFGGKWLELFRYATAGKRSKTAALCAPLFYRSEKFPSTVFSQIIRNARSGSALSSP
jgi:hypothetical protein